MLLSVGTGALSQMVADGADRGLSFVTECGDGSPVVSYITEEYEDDGTVVRSGRSGSGQMTFTCNVDWGEEIIPDMLEILEEKNVRVTFFVTGKWASKNTDLLRRMYLAGHEIEATDTVTGCALRSRRMNCVRNRKDRGCDTRSHRSSSEVFRTAVRGLQRKDGGILQGKRVPDDSVVGGYYRLARRSTADVIRQRILEKELDGAIVLMHPKEETVKALPGLIDEIRRRGIEPVKLSELLCEEESS